MAYRLPLVCLACLAASVAACSAAAGPPIQGDSADIIGGDRDFGDAAVVSIIVKAVGADALTFCSGSLIAPRVVLTAAHCVLPIFDGPTETVVALGDRVPLDPNNPRPAFLHDKTVAIARMVAHPDFHPERGLNDPTNDVGLVVLVDPITTVTPLRLNRRPLEAVPHASIRAVGFGASFFTAEHPELNTFPGLKKQVTVAVDSITANKLIAAKATCHGDSGGPGLMRLNGEEIVVAITSRSVEETASCDGRGVMERVDTQLAFIDRILRETDQAAP